MDEAATRAGEQPPDAEERATTGVDRRRELVLARTGRSAPRPAQIPRHATGGWAEPAAEADAVDQAQGEVVAAADGDTNAGTSGRDVGPAEFAGNARRVGARCIHKLLRYARRQSQRQRFVSCCHA